MTVDPLLLITILLSLIFIGGAILGAALLALVSKLSAQVAAIIATQQASIDANTATQIQTGLQGISDTLTGAGFPGP